MGSDSERPVHQERGRRSDRDSEAPGSPGGAAPGGRPAPPDAPEGSSVIADDWENSLLCGDPDCFGVIGPDGLCRECGKRVGGAESRPGPDHGSR